MIWVNVLTVLYAIIMVLLSVAILVGGGNCPINLTVVFLTFMVLIHVLAAILHWDFGTLICGLIYWIGIPSCFIFLQIYMIANINDVSWGTRGSSVAGESKDKAGFILETFTVPYENSIISTFYEPPLARGRVLTIFDQKNFLIKS